MARFLGDLEACPIAYRATVGSKTKLMYIRFGTLEVRSRYCGSSLVVRARFAHGTIEVRLWYGRGSLEVRSQFVRGTSYSIRQQDAGRTFNLPRPHAFASEFLLASTVSQCVQFKESSTERAATDTFEVRSRYCRGSHAVLLRFSRGTAKVRSRYCGSSLVVWSRFARVRYCCHSVS